MIGILNTAISVLAKLPFFKKGAGKVTVGGILAGAAATITGTMAPHVVTDQNVVAIIQSAATVITALATLVSAFGLGRRVEKVGE